MTQYATTHEANNASKTEFNARCYAPNKKKRQPLYYSQNIRTK